MSAITLRESHGNAMTLVSNVFIDRYMATANGEFVKIYLYLLRNLGQKDKEISISFLADIFEHTEKDILRALVYWEKVGLLNLTYSHDKELTAIDILDDNVRKDRKKIDKGKAEDSLPKETNQKEHSAKKPHSPRELEKLEDNKEFSGLMYIAQQYMGVALKPTDCDIFAYLYQKLRFSVELLEFLIEFSVSNGHTSVRYMEKVALDWHQRNITTVEKAKEYTSSYNKVYSKVMSAFGIKNRELNDNEKEKLEQWLHTYGFSDEIILEACNRTISNIYQPSFQYADTILADWKKQGVKNMEDIAALDLKFKNTENQVIQKPKRASNTKQNNKFHNFPQRTYDYDELLKQIRQ